MSGGCGGGCGSRRSISLMNESDRSPSRYSYAPDPNTVYYEQRQTTSTRRIGVRLPTPEEERMILAATSPSSNSRYLMNSSSSSSSSRPRESSYSRQYLDAGPSVSQRSLSRSISPRMSPKHSTSVLSKLSASRQSTMIEDDFEDEDPFPGSFQAGSFGSSRRSGCGC
ncbi:unnamed protein product [Ceutorhynchus assimilis]|uniref:Uncharacterized protein n=1 Tax=Ceutorhynchus assimilis TaxID=467358 RepID=A0A9N9MPT5_9CUCU|nr:unnamed protein product [Ceutorhynchus assimilis]